MAMAGVWEQSPQPGPGTEPPGQGVIEAKPPEAETLMAFGRSTEASNLPTFLKFGNADNHTHLCCLAPNASRKIRHTAQEMYEEKGQFRWLELVHGILWLICTQ